LPGDQFLCSVDLLVINYRNWNNGRLWQVSAERVDIAS